MAITTTGNIVDTRAVNGDYYVGGSAVGDLLVDGGSVFDVTAPGTEEPTFRIGQNAGVTGTSTVTGAGSKIVLTSTGQTGSGAIANIGFNGTGTQTITAGGELYVKDLVGTSSGPNQNGLDGVSISQSAGSNGTLTVNAGTVRIEGTGAFFNVTRNGGTGNATFSNGSQLVMTSLTAAANSLDGAYLQVGRGGGTGTMTLDASTATLLALGVSGAIVFVGRDSGNGTLNVQNNSTLTLSGGSSGAGINLGFDSVTGTNVGTGSAGTAVMTVANSNVTLDSTGGQAFVNVGRFNNANATLNLNSGGILSANGDTLATLSVATNGNAATTGTANFNAGRLRPLHTMAPQPAATLPVCSLATPALAQSTSTVALCTLSAPTIVVSAHSATIQITARSAPET